MDPFNRPTGMAFGPDGAICVLAFNSPLIENTAYSERDPGRDHSRGHVWRITSPANPLLHPLGIVDRPNRVLRYRQDQIDHTIDRMAQPVKDQHTWARTEAVLAGGFSAPARAPEAALQAAIFPMDARMQKAPDETTDFL